jgi:hypothetical protein
LKRARRDQRSLRPRETGEQRGDCEDHDPDDEHSLASQQIRRATAEHQEAAEDERVRADHPLEILLREPQVDLDRRQRHVDDRDVQYDHELHRAEERECEPFASMCVHHGCTSTLPAGGAQANGLSR